MIKTLKQLKRVLIGVLGGTIVIIGVVMIALPGPAFLVIPLGFSVLATEFLWAKRTVEKFKEKYEKVKNRFNGNRITKEL